MKTIQKLIFGMIIILVSAVSILSFVLYIGNSNWPVKYQEECDRFFGEGNWKCLDTERKKTSLISKYVDDDFGGHSEKGSYWNWDVEFCNPTGEVEVWTLTNLTMLANHEKNWMFSDKRLSSRQAMIMELYDIASGSSVSDDVINNIMKKYMTDEMIACFRVELSDNRPAPSDYDALWEEPWFNINDANLEHFLKFSQHEFGLWINVHEYKLEELSVQDQEKVLYSMDLIVADLLDKYGTDATFELYFGEGYEVEYQNGIIVDSEY